jgi:hypothetical protein
LTDPAAARHILQPSPITHLQQAGYYEQIEESRFRADDLYRQALTLLGPGRSHHDSASQRHTFDPRVGGAAHALLEGNAGGLERAAFFSSELLDSQLQMDTSAENTSMYGTLCRLLKLALAGC